MPGEPNATGAGAAHPGWPRAAAGWWLAVGLISWAAAPVWGSMVAIWWRSGTFNHAFAVGPIVAFLVWRSRRRWRVCEPRPDRRWWPLLMSCGLVLALAQAALLNAPSHLALVATLAVTVPALLGTAVARELAFPIGYAFFMVPIGEFMVPSMMEATATFTVWALQFSGVPVYREGLDFIIPSGNWSVVEACSGIRYLMASVTVGTLFAYLNFSSGRKRLAFVGVSIVVPVVANWLRAYLIVMLGHLTDNRLAAGVDHLIYGWLFFGLVMAVMFMIGVRWADPLRHEPQAGPAPAGCDPAPARAGGRFGGAAVAVALLAAAPQGLLHAGQWRAWWAPGVAPLAAPPAPQGWRAPVASLTAVPWPAFEQADHREHLSHAAQPGTAGPGAGPLQALRVVIDRQSLLHRIPVGQGIADPEVIDAPGRWPGLDERWMMVQRLRIDGQWWAPGAGARLALARVRLTGRPDRVEAWVWALPLSAGAPAARAASEEAARRTLLAVVSGLEGETGP